jgi:protoheme ferro-lyase
MQLERIEMLNTSPEMIAGLAELVRDVAVEKKWL